MAFLIALILEWRERLRSLQAQIASSPQDAWQLRLRHRIIGFLLARYDQSALAHAADREDMRLADLRAEPESELDEPISDLTALSPIPINNVQHDSTSPGWYPPRSQRCIGRPLAEIREARERKPTPWWRRLWRNSSANAPRPSPERDRFRWRF